MANFTNNISTVGTLYQAENMTFGGSVSSAEDLQRQVADLQLLLAKLTDIPESTRAAASAELDKAKQVAPSEPGAASKIVGKLETAKGFLQAATDIAKQTAPLIGAIGAVVAAATRLVI